MEDLIDAIMILGVIQVTLVVLMFFFGFKKEEPDEMPTIDFDWKREGF